MSRQLQPWKHAFSLAAGIVLLGLSSTAIISAQQAAGSATTAANVPTLIKFSGTLSDVQGRASLGVAGVTFAIYQNQSGGAPLWLETQNVNPDASGRYSVYLGATHPTGLPGDLFETGGARWVGVQAEGQPEQPRVLLVSVPYSLKAADANTLGGRPASAYVTADQLGLVSGAAGAHPSPASTSGYEASAAAPSSLATSDVTTTGGAVNAIPLFSTKTNIQNSILSQSGTSINVGGTLNLPALGTATATTGYNSRPHDFVASAYNSSVNEAVPQTFLLQAEATGNDTANASGTLNLLYATGTGTPAETGLKISSTGKITFAGGQTFTGNGSGLTNINAADLGGLSSSAFAQLGAASNTFTGGLTASSFTGNGSGLTNVSAANSTQLSGLGSSAFAQLGAASNTFTGGLIASSFTGNGAGLTNVSAANSAELGGLASGAYAQLGAANTFTMPQTINGPLYASYTVANSAAITGQDDNGSFSIGVNGMSVSGIGVYGQGGSYGLYGLGANDASGVAGGVGATFSGGNESGSSGGASSGIGVEAGGGTGSNGNFGGDGGLLSGGPSDTTAAGKGIVVYGGHSTSGNGGDGGDFFGGSTSSGAGNGGFGIYALGGSNGSSVENLAGYFNGDIEVTGTVYGSAKDFRIDHPVDPANRYLDHAAVESSEMMNIYTGNVTTDAAGEAVVHLPDWFEAVNTDFRYQLTAVGQFAQAIVSQKIVNGQFAIRTDKPNVEVSWLVTGVRQDAFAKAHPLQVEVEKPERERGRYIHPELYGQPQEKNINWEHMERMNKMRPQQKAPRPALPILRPAPQSAALRPVAQNTPQPVAQVGK